MCINKDILRSYIFRLFTGPTEEVLQHPGVALHCPAGAGALLFLGQEGIESSLPASLDVGEVGNRRSHDSNSFL